MPIKGLECRDVIPGSDCKLLLVGEVDEVAQAFAAHAAQRHAGDADVSGEVHAKLQAAVFVSPDRAYVGDQYSRNTDGSIALGGSGVFVQRFFPSESAKFDEATSGGTLTCMCSEGVEGSCSITILDSVAKCTGDSCCKWVIGSPPHGGAPPPDKVLLEFG